MDLPLDGRRGRRPGRRCSPGYDNEWGYSCRVGPDPVLSLAARLRRIAARDASTRCPTDDGKFQGARPCRLLRSMAKLTVDRLELSGAARLHFRVGLLDVPLADGNTITGRHAGHERPRCRPSELLSSSPAPPSSSPLVPRPAPKADPIHTVLPGSRWRRASSEILPGQPVPLAAGIVSAPAVPGGARAPLRLASCSCWRALRFHAEEANGRGLQRDGPSMALADVYRGRLLPPRLHQRSPASIQAIARPSSNRPRQGGSCERSGAGGAVPRRAVSTEARGAGLEPSWAVLKVSRPSGALVEDICLRRVDGLLITARHGVNTSSPRSVTAISRSLVVSRIAIQAARGPCLERCPEPG